MFVGLVGKAGSGKDSLGQYLFRKYDLYLASFALPLKQKIIDDFGLEWADVNTQEGKGYKHEALGGRTPGEVLQMVGELYRQIDPNYWLNLALGSPEVLIYGKTHSVIFTDCRFPNEAAAIRALGGKIVRVVATGAPPLEGRDPNHPSETAMDGYGTDARLVAEYGDLPSLFQGARKLFDDWGLRCRESSE